MNTFGCCGHSCTRDCVDLSFISLEHIPRSVAGSGGHSMWTLPGTGLFAPEKAERPGGYFTGQEAQAADGPASGLGGKGSDNISHSED